MKSFFTGKKLLPLLTLLLLIGTVVSTGVTRARYMETIPVGSFDLYVKSKRKQVFAVLNTDNSLDFHQDKEENIPAVNDTYNNKTVSAVYRDIETTAYTGHMDDRHPAVAAGSFPDWHSSAETITSVNFYASVSPISTSGWFAGFLNCTVFDGLELLDTSRAGTMASMFCDCQKLTDADLAKLTINTASATSLWNMFRGCTSLKNSGGNSFRFTNTASAASPLLTELRGMFRGCTALEKLDLRDLYISADQVNFAHMFMDCNSVTEINFPDRPIFSFLIDQNCVDDGTRDMFRGCLMLKTVDISFIRCQSVDPTNMFYNCRELETIFAHMGFACSEASLQGIGMFNNCSKLVGGNGTTLAYISSALPPADPLNGIFDSADHYKFAWIDGHNGLPGYLTAKDQDDMDPAAVKVSVAGDAGFLWNEGDFTLQGQRTFFATPDSIVNNVIRLTPTAEKMPSNVTVNIDGVVRNASDGVIYDSSAATLTIPSRLIGMASIITVDKYGQNVFAVYSQRDNSLRFYNRSSSMEFERDSYSTVYKDIGGGYALYKAENSSSYISDAPWEKHKNNITSITVEDEGIAPSSMAGWFTGFRAVTSVDLSKLDTRNVSSFERCFEGCSSLTVLDLSGWHTSGASSFRGMFRWCTSLTSLNISSFSLERANDLGMMFDDCTNLSSMTTGSGFSLNRDIPHIDLEAMFYNCRQMTDLSFVQSWDVASVQNMKSLFSGCSGITFLDLSGWHTPNVTSMWAMFKNCTKLAGIEFGQVWTLQNVNNASEMFYHCEYLTSLDLSRFDNTSNLETAEDVFVGTYRLAQITSRFTKIMFDFVKREGPDPAYIDGADGKWYDAATGIGYLPSELPPSNNIITYVAVKPELADTAALPAPASPCSCGEKCTESFTNSDCTVCTADPALCCGADAQLPAGDDDADSPLPVEDPAETEIPEDVILPGPEYEPEAAAGGEAPAAE